MGKIGEFIKIAKVSDSPIYTIKKIFDLTNTYLFGKAPATLTLDISSTCNLKCGMCSLNKWQSSKNLMQMETFNKLLPIFPKVKAVGFTCSGEPLMNKNIVEMVRAIKEVSHNTTLVGFNTNAMLLNERIAGELIDANLDMLEFSVDGATKKTYESIRVGAKFDTVIKNIRNLIETKKRLGKKNLNLSIRMTVSRDNINELSAMVELARELGISKLLVNGIEPYTKEMAAKTTYGRKPNKEVEKLFTLARKKAREHNMQLVLPELTPFEYTKCKLSDCTICWDGEVVPCSQLSYKRPYYYFGLEKKHPKLIFGSINEKSLLDIWNSEKYTAFRKQLMAGKFPEFCKYCLMKNRVLCP